MSTRRAFGLAGLPVITGCAATIVTLALVWLVAPAKSYLHDFFFDRSWIQYASTLCFWTAIAVLVIKHRRFRAERHALEAARSRLAAKPFGPGQPPLIWAQANDVRRGFADAANSQSLAFSRIVHALDRLFKTKSTQSMQEYCRTRGELDATELDTGYADLRYLIWLIPTLGFIGTVMGIGQAISGFAGIISTASDFNAVRQYLPTVAYYLGTAFDTTLLALALSAIAVFYMSWLTKQQEQLLTNLDTLCLDGLCSSFQEHSTASSDFIEAVNDVAKQLVDRMNGNRGAVVDVIREELPQRVAQAVEEMLRARPGPAAGAGPASVADALERLIRAHGELIEILRATAPVEPRGARTMADAATGPRSPGQGPKY